MVNNDSTLKVAHILILSRYLTKSLWLKIPCKISEQCRLKIFNIFLLLHPLEYLFSET